MKYQIFFTKKALKNFLRLPKALQAPILNKLEFLVDNPFMHNINIKKLQGVGATYRLRVGDYRVLYKICIAKLIVEVINVAHRREAYQ